MTDDFESALRAMAVAWEQLPTEEKSTKVRRVLNSSAGSPLSEFVGLIHGAALSSDCHCVDCPHKKELANFNDFYHQFIMEP